MKDDALKNFGLRMDIKGLPEELLNELLITKIGELGSQIIDVIDNTYHGMANIDTDN